MINKFVLFLILFSIGISSCKTKESQVGANKEKPSEVLPFKVDENSFMMKMQAEALKEPFMGVYSSNGKEEHLFPIKSTGVTTEPIVEAGKAFITSLSIEQLKKTLFQLQDEE